MCLSSLETGVGTHTHIAVFGTQLGNWQALDYIKKPGYKPKESIKVSRAKESQERETKGKDRKRGGSGVRID